MNRCSTTTTQHTGHNHRIDYTNRHVRVRSRPPPIEAEEAAGEFNTYWFELPSRLVLTVETCANRRDRLWVYNVFKNMTIHKLSLDRLLVGHTCKSRIVTHIM
eukprot:COSAG01_NODE_455_length_16792_cov_112.440424_3_plen_103_part_00